MTFPSYVTALLVLILMSTANARPLALSRKAMIASNQLLHQVNIFFLDGKDPRVVKSQAGAGNMYAAIGKIYGVFKLKDKNTGNMVDVKSRGTAFVISPCHIIANYHAVFGSDEAADTQTTAQFASIQPDGTFRKILATPILGLTGDFSFDGATSSDYSVLKLSSCVGKKNGWLELAELTNAEIGASKFSIAGFPGDKSAKKLWFQPECNNRTPDMNTAAGELLCDYSTQPGSSGSPVFVTVDGRSLVVGMVQADYNSTSETQNEFAITRSTSVLDVRGLPKNLKLLIEADTAAFGKPNPADLSTKKNR